MSTKPEIVITLVAGNKVEIVVKELEPIAVIAVLEMAKLQAVSYWQSIYRKERSRNEYQG